MKPESLNIEERDEMKPNIPGRTSPLPGTVLHQASTSGGRSAADPMGAEDRGSEGVFRATGPMMRKWHEMKWNHQEWSEKQKNVSSAAG